MRFILPLGPLRALVPTKSSRHRVAIEREEDRGVVDLFSSFVLGAPMIMITTTSWPLDLFITPPTLSAYSEINAYLMALRDTHLRVLSTWTCLSAAQRQRRKWTGDNEGGATDEVLARRELARKAWGIVRIMLFWLDEVIGHFMTDIIDVQHRRLLEQLQGVSNPTRLSASTPTSNSRRGSVRPASPATQPTPGPLRSHAGDVPGSPAQSTHHGNFDTATVRSKAPPTPSKQAPKRYLDFITLRTMHSRHLSFLREGLLIADKGLAVMVRDILETCRRFAGFVERWGGDVLPGLLEDDSSGDDGVGILVQERHDAINEIMSVSLG
jgi:gamma-tubulin complex component 4